MTKNIDIIFDIEMDLYFLLRLFIIFDEKKMNRGPVYCRDLKYKEIKNAIVYAGAYHIDIYLLFLKQYFGIEPEINIQNDSDNKCLEFEKPFDFFQKTGKTLYTKSIFEPEKPSQEQAKEKMPYIIVFDFDGTLTSAHWFYFINKFNEFKITWLRHTDIQTQENLLSISRKINENINDLSELVLNENENDILIDKFFGGHHRLKMLKAFLTQLKNKSHQLCISSNGRCNEILFLLRLAKIDTFFELKNGEYLINAHGGSRCVEADKDKYMISLYNKNKNMIIVYIDDDNTYHERLKDQIPVNKYKYFGKNIGLLKDRRGLTAVMMNTILEWIEKSQLPDVKSSKKIVVLDFDNTILYTNWSMFVGNFGKFIDKYWNKKKLGSVYDMYNINELKQLNVTINKTKNMYFIDKHSKNMIIEIFWGGQTRLTYMKTFVEKLNMKCDLHISSSASCNLVVNMLSAFSFDKFFASTDRYRDFAYDFNRINASGSPCYRAREK